LNMCLPESLSSIDLNILMSAVAFMTLTSDYPIDNK
jgi:hypothetical protein